MDGRLHDHRVGKFIGRTQEVCGSLEVEGRRSRYSDDFSSPSELGLVDQMGSRDSEGKERHLTRRQDGEIVLPGQLLADRRKPSLCRGMRDVDPLATEPGRCGEGPTRRHCDGRLEPGGRQGSDRHKRITELRPIGRYQHPLLQRTHAPRFLNSESNRVATSVAKRCSARAVPSVDSCASRYAARYEGTSLGGCPAPRAYAWMARPTCPLPSRPVSSERYRGRPRWTWALKRKWKRS